MSVMREADVHAGETYFDLGPAWFWPSSQAHITQLAERLGVGVFAQFADGAMRVEQFRLETPHSFVPDHGMTPDALRFRGGVQALVSAIAATLPAGAIQLNRRVTRIVRNDSGGVTIIFNDAREEQARAIVLALPPRVIAAQISFEPALPDELHVLMRATPTWMAPHAKMLAVYAKPFWREAGYSGMASSFVGPLQEIHDASPETGLGALFGFVGIGAATRAAIGEVALRERVIAQLTRLFGERAALPLNVYFKDWAPDTHTTTSTDLEPAVLPHGPDGVLYSASQWDGKILFAGAETAAEHPGYLEGAVRAAERAVAWLVLTGVRLSQ